MKTLFIIYRPYSIIARGEADGNTADEDFIGGLRWRYTGQYFYYLPATTYITHFITYIASPTTCITKIFYFLLKFISLLFITDQITVHEQLTIARYHDFTGVGKQLWYS